jgi:hypothetical protein
MRRRGQKTIRGLARMRFPPACIGCAGGDDVLRAGLQQPRKCAPKFRPSRRHVPLKNRRFCPSGACHPGSDPAFRPQFRGSGGIREALSRSLVRTWMQREIRGCGAKSRVTSGMPCAQTCRILRPLSRICPPNSMSTYVHLLYNVHLCPPMSTYVHLCPPIIQCPPMSTYVHLCPPTSMSTYVHLCPPM